MVRKQVASKYKSKTKPQKTTERRGISRWVALVFVILLIASVIGTLVFQGGDGSGNIRPVSVLRTADYHALAFSPDNPDVVFFGHHDGIMRSDDGGKTWRQLVNRTNFDAMSLSISKNDSQMMYLAGHDILQISRSGGATWSPMRNNLPGSDIHAFTASLDNPGRFYAFVVGFGLFRSNDAGLTWEDVSTRLPEDILAVAAAGGNPETFYAGSMQSGVFKSTDGGRNWTPVSGLTIGGVMTLAVDPAEPKTIFAGGGGLYKSVDAGDSWVRLNLPADNIAALALSPVQPGRLLVINVANGRGQVYRSEDWGVTW